MNWPAGLVSRLMYLEGVHNIFKAMVSSRNIVEFFNANPQAGAVVGRVTALRAKHGN